MKVAAIICEYNPFHNGHKYQLDEVRRICGKDTAIIALMSGSYVQRGDVAVFSKASRAAAAIQGGADLVLELPVYYATQSAEFFAKGAVYLLNSLGFVDYLAFGAESANLPLIENIAELFCNEPPEFSDKLSELCNTGISFPAARAKTAGEILGKDAAKLLNEPNNILAVEYCKALKSLESPIKPLLIQRTGAMHHEQHATNGIASATHIRSLISQRKTTEAFSYMPDFCSDIFKDEKARTLKSMEKAIIADIIKTDSEALRKISDVGEGLENRIKEKALTANGIEELADAVKTKRYTHSRIRRILLSSYLGITAKDREFVPRYIRILAHSETGQALIRKAKKASSMPLVRNTSQINRLNDPIAKEIWERERIFDLIYDLF